MSQIAAEIMNTQDDYAIDDVFDDDYLDDPITLIDYEQARINAISHDLDNSAVDVSHHKSSNLTSISNVSSCTTSHFVLPVTFFNNSSNLKLLSDCRPMAIKVVDCDKYPWYYRNYISHPFNKTQDHINSQEDLTSTVECIIDLVTDVTPVMSLDRSDDVNKWESNNSSLSINQNELLTEKLKYLKRSKDIEIEVALQMKNEAKIDYKKNIGLVGLKITPRIEVAKTALDKHTFQMQNDSLKENKVIDVDDYILGVDRALNGVGTIMLPVDQENSKRATNKNKKSIDKNKIIKKKKTTSATEKKSKHKSEKKEKHTESNQNKIKNLKKLVFKDMNCKLKAFGQSSVSSIVKISNVKDKKKTNKYINDLLKKKNAVLNVIKSMQSKTPDREIEYYNNSVAELDKQETFQNNESHIDIVPKDMTAIKEAGVKSPLLPCNKLTLKSSSDRYHSKKPMVDLGDKTIVNEIPLNLSITKENAQNTNSNDIAIIKEIPTSISISKLNSKNTNYDGEAVKKEIPNSISISKIDSKNTNYDGETVKKEIPNSTVTVTNSNSISKLDSQNTNDVYENTLKGQENINSLISDMPESLRQNSLNDIIISNVISVTCSEKPISSVNDNTSSNNPGLSNITTNDSATAISVSTHRKISNNPGLSNITTNDSATAISVSTHRKISKNHNISITQNKDFKSKLGVEKPSNKPVLCGSGNSITFETSAGAEKKLSANRRQKQVRKKSWSDPNIDVQNRFNSLNTLKFGKPCFKRSQPPAFNSNFAHCPYTKKVSSAQRDLSQPKPLMSNVIFWPYLPPPPPPAHPPPPPPPAHPPPPPPPPPPSPPALLQQKQNSSQYIPYQVQTTRVDSFIGKDSTNVTENLSITLVPAKKSADKDSARQGNMHSNNKPEEPIITPINSKSEMLQELEKGMMTIHNDSSEEAVQKPTSLRNNYTDTKHPVVMTVSNTKCQSSGENLMEHRPVPKKFNRLFTHKNTKCAYDNNNKLSSLVNNLKNDLNMSHNSLNHSTSSLVGTKINAFRHKPPESKPKIGPLSKTSNVRHLSSAQLENKTTNEKSKINKSYSPPILPIPTYQNSREMLHQADSEPQRLPVLLSNEIRKKHFEMSTGFSRTDNNNRVPHKAICSDTNSRKRLHFSDEKKNTCKKISLDEYKKRESKMKQLFDGSNIYDTSAKKVKKCRKDEGTSRTVKSLSQIVNHHPEQDLGYDSDSTIILTMN